LKNFNRFQSFEVLFYPECRLFFAPHNIKTIQHVEIKPDCIMLVRANKSFKPIKVTPEEDFVIWGVVRYVIKKLK
jgi:hypothetical protein